MAHQLPTDLIQGDQGLLSGLALWAYNVTGGFFWTGMLATFCIVMFIATSRYNATRAFGFAAFTGLSGAIFLAIAGLMPWWTASLFILTGVVGLAMLVLSEK